MYNLFWYPPTPHIFRPTQGKQKQKYVSPENLGQSCSCTIINIMSRLFGHHGTKWRIMQRWKASKKIDNDRLFAGALPPSPSDSGVSDVELSSSSQVGNKLYHNITNSPSPSSLVRMSSSSSSFSHTGLNEISFIVLEEGSMPKVLHNKCFKISSSL